MKKKKAKIGIFILLSMIGLPIGLIFAGYLNLLLSGVNITDLSALRPAMLAVGIFTDERQRMLTLCVMIIIETGIAAFVLLSRKETFESDTADITKDIKTPIAIGQGQHGTARWMTAVEKREAFSRYRLDKRELSYSDLLRAGRNEAKDVMNYIEKPEDDSVSADAPPDSKPETEKTQENQ